jgi:hypothetical protein
MLKKLLTLSAVLLLVSCQSKTKSDDLRTEDKINIARLYFNYRIKYFKKNHDNL